MAPQRIRTGPELRATADEGRILCLSAAGDAAELAARFEGARDPQAPRGRDPREPADPRPSVRPHRLRSGSGVDTFVSFVHNSAMLTPTLRDRQSALAREAIVEVFVQHLETGDVDDVPMESLAREAGVSRRTLYRYFPTRDALLVAAGEALRERLGLPFEIGAEGIAASFRTAATRLQRRPALARALLRTEAGRATRGSYRPERVEAVRRAVDAELPALGARERERAAAVLAYLCSSRSWISIQDESGLDQDEARDAVAWAIEALLAQMRGQAGET